jgi:hypothetical protein
MADPGMIPGGLNGLSGPIYSATGGGIGGLAGGAGPGTTGTPAPAGDNAIDDLWWDGIDNDPSGPSPAKSGMYTAWRKWLDDHPNATDAQMKAAQAEIFGSTASTQPNPANTGNTAGGTTVVPGTATPPNPNPVGGAPAGGDGALDDLWGPDPATGGGGSGSNGGVNANDDLWGEDPNADLWWDGIDNNPTPANTPPPPSGTPGPTYQPPQPYNPPPDLTPPPMPGTPGGLGAPIYPGEGGGGVSPLPTTPPPVDNSGAAGSLFQGFQDAQNAAQQANEERYGQILQGYGGLYNNQDQLLGDIAGGYGNMLTDATAQYSNLLGGYNAVTGQAADQYGGILGAYGQNAADQMARLSSLGQAEAQRIGTAANQQEAAATQNLISRGLGNTTVAPNVSRGIQSDASRNMTQLAEDLAREQNTTQQATTMPALGAAAQFTGNIAQLGTQGLQAGERFSGAQSDLAGQGLQFGERANQAQVGLGSDILGFMNSRQDEYPSFETLANLAVGLGQAGSPIPSMPAPGPTSDPYLPTPNVGFFSQNGIAPPPPVGGTAAPPLASRNGLINPAILAVTQGYQPA